MWYKFSARPKKLYFYNNEDKPLIHHIEDIFPGANSVDIFYITEKVRALINGSQLSPEEILWNVEHRTVFPTKEHLKRSRE